MTPTLDHPLIMAEEERAKLVHYQSMTENIPHEAERYYCLCGYESTSKNQFTLHWERVTCGARSEE
jgi:hypothetical protein